jgi:hypothetical protein
VARWFSIWSRLRREPSKNACFGNIFRHAWTIAAQPSDDDSAWLVAVDEHQWILGADRVARDILGLDNDKLGCGVPLPAAFEFDRSIFRQTGERDIPARVLRAGDGASWYALFTPPLSKFRMVNWAEVILHCRPRINTLGHLPVVEPLAPSRGGLPPVVTQRICEYSNPIWSREELDSRGWLRWQGFPHIVSRGHSINRWEFRLTAIF